MIPMSFVKRFLFALSAMLLIAVLAAPSVGASGPQKVKLVIPTPGTFGGLCTFEVDYDVVVNTEYNIVFTDSAGNPTVAITQGRLIVRFTNASNGHSLTLNISGPGKTTTNPDGSQTIAFLGNGVLFTDTIVYNTGRVVLVAPDALSPGVIVSASGLQRDLCDMLA